MLGSLTCVTLQLWDTAIKHFALTDGAVSYLGKQRCCFLPGKLLQRQQRLSVVGFCVILDIMNLWPKARCSVAGIASLFCRSVFSVCFCLCSCLRIRQNLTEPGDNMELFPAPFADVEKIFLFYTLNFTVVIFISL